MTDKQRKAAQACFELNKNLDAVIVTSDGNCFTSKNLSDNHAKEARLDKAATVIVTRDMVEDEEVSNETAQPAAKPFKKMNKSELLNAVSELGIEVPEGATNKDIVALLEATAGEKGGAE